MKVRILNCLDTQIFDMSLEEEGTTQLEDISMVTTLSQEELEKRRLIFKKNRIKGSQKKNGSFKKASPLNENEANEEEDNEDGEQENTMFYTGEDVSQKQNGRLRMKGIGENNNNSTLASLNERKFQTRKSEQEMQGFFYHEKNNNTELTNASFPTHQKTKKNAIVAGLDLRSGAEVKEVKALSPARKSTVNGIEAVENLSIDLRMLENGNDHELSENLPKLARTTNLTDFGTQYGPESKRITGARGLKSVDNPDVIKFQEQSEWLDKMVKEEVKAQKIKKEKGFSQATTPRSTYGNVSARSLMGDSSYGTPVNASEPSEHEIEETPIVLQNRKDWLESLAQQGVSPRSQQSDENNGGFGSPMFDLVSKDVVYPQSIQGEMAVSSHNNTTSRNKLENGLLNTKVPLNDTVDGVKARGDAYMMPSKIKELRSGNASPRARNVSQTNQAEFHQQAVAKLSLVENIRSSNDARTASAASGTGRVEIPCLSIEDSPRMTTSTLPNGEMLDSAVDGGEVYTTSSEAKSIKDRVKKFQKEDSQTTDYFTPRVPRNPDSKSSVARPKSFHAEQGGSGDYRYTGNDYDSTELRPVNNKLTQGKPEMQIKLVTDPSVERANNYDKNNNNNKSVSTGSSKIEYKLCVKDTRILQEIEDQESREMEVKTRRNYGINGQHVQASGGLHQFLAENELK